MPATIANGYFAEARFGEFYFAQAPEVRGQLRFDIRMSELHGVKLYKHGAVGGMEIYDAVERFGLQQFKQRNDSTMSIERNFVSEVNEKRLVTGGLKSHIRRKHILHRGESISHATPRKTLSARMPRVSADL